MAFKSYSDYLLLEKNYSALTVNAYTADLNEFLKFITQEYQSNNIATVNYAIIRAWIVNLVETGISNRSVNRKISALNSYYKFLLKTESLTINPLVKHKSLKVSKKIQIPFSEREVAQVLNADIDENTFEQIRDKCIVELFYSTGIRRIELVDLKINNIDFSNKTIKVLGKRNKERIIPLLPSVISTLYKYLEVRSTLVPIEHSDFLFLVAKGTKIYETLVYRIINLYFSKVSTKVKKSPHILRHSFATHLLNQGADLNAVKELLGHTSLAATQVYTHNSIAELKKVHFNKHPRSKKE